jgi:hypothetical protein
MMPYFGTYKVYILYAMQVIPGSISPPASLPSFPALIPLGRKLENKKKERKGHQQKYDDSNSASEN